MLSKAKDTNCVGKLNPQPTWKFQKVPKLDAVQPRDQRNACSSANQWRQSWTLICCHTIRSWCATDPACVGSCMAILVGTCWYCRYFGDGSGKRSWNELELKVFLCLQFACFGVVSACLSWPKLCRWTSNWWHFWRRMWSIVKQFTCYGGYLDVVGTVWNSWDSGQYLYLGQLGVLKCVHDVLRDARSARSCLWIQNLRIVKVC